MYPYIQFWYLRDSKVLQLWNRRGFKIVVCVRKLRSQDKLRKCHSLWYLLIPKTISSFRKRLFSSIKYSIRSFEFVVLSSNGLLLILSPESETSDSKNQSNLKVLTFWKKIFQVITETRVFFCIKSCLETTRILVKITPTCLLNLFLPFKSSLSQKIKLLLSLSFISFFQLLFFHNNSFDFPNRSQKTALVCKVGGHIL